MSGARGAGGEKARPWALAAAGGKRGSRARRSAERPPSLCRVRVLLAPAVRDPHWATFLQQLRVDWPAAPERASAEALRRRALAEVTSAGDRAALPAGGLGSVCLKALAAGRGRAAGRDLRRDRCVGRTGSRAGPGEEGPVAPASPVLSPAVTEDMLSLLAELQAAAQPGPEDGSPGLVSS